VGLDRGAYEAVDAFHAGLDRLADTNGTRVFPGHGPAFDDASAVVETTRHRLEELVEQVAERPAETTRRVAWEERESDPADEREPATARTGDEE